MIDVKFGCASSRYVRDRPNVTYDERGVIVPSPGSNERSGTASREDIRDQKESVGTGAPGDTGKHEQSGDVIP